MKEKLLNNLGLKVASLVLAFAVWMAIVNISNPIIDDSQSVAVEIRNTEVLAARNLAYEIEGKDVVTVSYQVRTRDRSLVKASDFHAYADLKDYNVTGAVPITVEINKDKENLVKSDAITAKPMVIRIVTEALQRKQFDLQVNTKGTPEEGYALGISNPAPSFVTVEGRSTLIGQISRIGVEVDVNNANADMDVKVTPILYDANGNKLDLGNKVTVNPHEIECHISILKAKNIAVNFEVSGAVAGGYRYTGLESSVKSVPVVGTKSVLASLSTLSITSDKLNIDGATADKVVELDLSQYLPPNTTVVGNEYKNVKVKLKVEPLVTKVFSLDLDTLDKKGMDADSNYTFDKETSDVTVRGLKEDLDSLDVKKLGAILDVTNFHPGQNQGILKLEIPGGFEVVGYTPFIVVLAHKEPASATVESSTASTTEAAGPQ